MQMITWPRSAGMCLCMLSAHGGAFAQTVDMQVDLSTGKLPQGWIIAEGKWVVQDGELRQQDDTKHPAKLFFAAPMLTDFELSAAFKIAPSRRSVRSAGFLFRAADTANYAYFHCNSDLDMVAFARATDNAYWTVPKRFRNVGLTAGEWHTARITGKGSTFTFELDGKQVAKASYGELGVGCLGLGSCSAQVAFKEIHIRGTQAPETAPFRRGSSRHVCVVEGRGAGVPPWAPSLLCLSDGALLLTYSGAANGTTPHQNLAARSIDAGLNWQPADAAAPDSDGPATEPRIIDSRGRLTVTPDMRVRRLLTGNPHARVSREPVWPGASPSLTRCSNGDILFFVDCKDRGTHVLRSSDFGETWQGPIIVCADAYGRVAATELADGSVIAAHARGTSGALVVSRLDVRGPQIVPAPVGAPLPQTIAGIAIAGNEATIVAPAIARVNPRNTEGSVVELKDGRLLLAYTRFYGGGSDHAFADISGMISEDKGRTWSRPFLVQRNDAGCNVMSASLLRLQTGEILLGYLRKNASRTDCRFAIRLSTDEGRTWGPEVCATPEPVEYYVVNNDRVIQLRNGRLLVPAADHADWHKRRRAWAVCYFSDDKGKTWRRGSGHIELPGCGCQEPGIVELKDGRVYMIIRNSLGSVYRAISADGGDTWSEATSTGLPAPVAPCSIKKIPTTGDLLLIWNHSKNRRVPLTAALSSDDGETWHHIRDIETQGGSFAYTSICFVDQTAVLSYWCSRGGLSLTVRRIPVNWFYSE